MIPAWVASVLISFAISIVAGLLMPKPKVENAKPQRGRVPEANEGTIIRKIYGEIWIPDSQVLAWKELEPEPIRKGGKK